MSVSVITERIRASLSTGELAPVRPPLEAVPIVSIGDLLRPWEEIFPGARRDDGERREIFGFGALRKPRFRPEPRRSRKPLPPPIPAVAPRKAISPEFFESFAAVWQWYEQRGIAKQELLLAPVTSEAINQFVAPLCEETSDHYPMSMCLEEYGYHDSLCNLGPVCLYLPHMTWEDEEVGVFEAFLSGTDGLLGLLRTLVERESFINVPPADLALIESVGYAELVACYAAYDGKKSLDVSGLEAWTTTYFGEVSRKHPQIDVETIPVILSDPSEAEVIVLKPEDIDFALDYAAAWEAMTGLSAMPWPRQVEENDERAADQLVHEVCEVWRKKHRKKSVPLGKTLVEVFRDEKC